jgi:hypothetical protein
MPLTGEEIQERGLAALRRELGRAGLARFLRHFESGSGDYVRERSKLLAGLTMDDLRRRARERDKKKKKRNA